MNDKKRYRYRTSLLCSLLLGCITSGQAQDASPLDAAEQPPTPRYESLFPAAVVPLDTELSWKNRFSGNEFFNPQESLPPTSPVIDRQLESMQEPTGAGGDSAAFDATGVVRQVKAADGKVKIEHGPIERLGMPAMTMLFRVDDPNRLAGLEKGATVNFDVDNTAAGFTITRIEPMADRFDASGIVRQVKPSDGKIKVEHGPIERLGMPAMTMLFRVEDPAQLAGLDKGSEIEFDVDNTAAGFTITRLRQASASPASPYDARGTVKTIRADQGKVKIAHGPIERLGMPAMTMLFKVKRPEDLDALQVGMSIEFDVHNGTGGFELTRFRPLGADTETGGMNNGLQ